MKNDVVKTSKFLSYVLRHKPQSIGLQLDAAGWAEVDELIACATQNGRRLTRQMILTAVSENNKQRFGLRENGRFIRANQGHSIPVDLNLQPVSPPDQLFHGTATHFLATILQEGLRPMRRHHVHLSGDVETAVNVGQRHGTPVILHIAAGKMAAEGHTFYCSENGVWLTDSVPPSYLEARQ
ncbi:MAG: RNA 2'-phosphotransferase [Chloroflexota bacterium]